MFVHVLALGSNFAIVVASMYLEKTRSQGKYTCYLLRESYRQDGKVKHRTIVNLSRCSPQEIDAIRLARRTRGHVFVVMLGDRVVQELAGRWSSLNLTVQEGLDELSSLCATEAWLQGSARCQRRSRPLGHH
jgi:hypothetical protein